MDGFLLSLLVIAGLAAKQPVDRASTRCSMISVPLSATLTDWKLDRCGDDIEDNAIWQVDRSDSSSGDLDGQVVRRTTGRGAVVYVVDTGILQRHVEFLRAGEDSSVIGGFDAYEASGVGRSPCPSSATDPCYEIPSHRNTYGHGTTVASMVGGRSVGIAPDAKLYAERIFPAPVPDEPRMWHVALDDIIRHAWDPATPPFRTAIVTCSVPATPQPNDPLYLSLVEKVRRMTQGVDAAGNEDPAGKKFLFTVAAGNLVTVPVDLCGAFPAILGKEMDGVVTVGGLTRDNVWWSGSCKGDTVEVVAPAEMPVLASLAAPDNYVRGLERSGTSFAAPYVAGIAARLLETNPTRTPAELEALLKDSPSHAADSGLPVPVIVTGRELRKPR